MYVCVCGCLVAEGEVGALMRRDTGGIQTLRPAGQWWCGDGCSRMSGIHIAIGIVGAGLWIDASRIFITACGRGWCRVPAGLWLPLRLWLLPLRLRLLPVLLRLWLPLGLRLLPLGLRLLPLRLWIVQARIITDGKTGAVLWIHTGGILGSWRMLWLGQSQRQAGGEQLQEHKVSEAELNLMARQLLTSLKNMLIIIILAGVCVCVCV